METPVHIAESVFHVHHYISIQRGERPIKGTLPELLLLTDTEDQGQAIGVLFPWTPSRSGELLYLVIFYSVSSVDFSLLQQDREMGPHHRLVTNAADGEMLEKPRKARECSCVSITSLALLCPSTWETPYLTDEKETLERCSLKNNIVYGVSLLTFTMIPKKLWRKKLRMDQHWGFWHFHARILNIYNQKIRAHQSSSGSLAESSFSGLRFSLAAWFRTLKSFCALECLEYQKLTD